MLVPCSVTVVVMNESMLKSSHPNALRQHFLQMTRPKDMPVLLLCSLLILTDGSQA